MAIKRQIDKTSSPSVVKINPKSEWKRFMIRKEGKNADLIGKESLWIYTVLKIEQHEPSENQACTRVLRQG
jgi:hypothetical protein